jgi:hypothetical protein
MLMFAHVRQALSLLPKSLDQRFPSQVRVSQFQDCNSKLKGSESHRFKRWVAKFWSSALKPWQQWLETIEVITPGQAHFLCKFIPAQCPFERDVQLGAWQLHIPPLCKLNPFYDQFVILRFRALTFLADECGEDVTCYCQAAPKG